MALLVVPVLANDSAVSLPDGLIGLRTVQQVTGVLSGVPYCAFPAPPSGDSFTGCGQPAGVGYVAPSRSLVAVSYQVGLSGTGNYSQNVNVSTWVPTADVSLPCDPQSVYVPAAGADFYVPCYSPHGAPGFTGIERIADNGGDVVQGLALPTFVAFGWSMLSLDPTSGLLYACEYFDSTLTAVWTNNGTIALSRPLATGCDGLLYDPAADVLLVSNNGSNVSVVDALTGGIERTIPTPYLVESAVYYPTGGLIALSLTRGPYPNERGQIEFLNSTTLAVESSMTLQGANYLWGTAEYVPGFLIADPAHGDIYAVAHGEIFAVNVSERSVVGTISTGTSLEDWQAAYDPADDWIFQQAGDGYMGVVGLRHTQVQVVTDLFGLPPTTGILAIGGGVGALLAGTSLARRPDALFSRPRSAIPRS